MMLLETLHLLLTQEGFDIQTSLRISKWLLAIKGELISNVSKLIEKLIRPVKEIK